MTGKLSIAELRKHVVQVAHKAKEGHIPSALSVLDILFVLYRDFIDFDSENSSKNAINHFVLSKGHASLALYVVLFDIGVLREEELYSFAQFDSILGGHPDRNKVPRVESSTGSLGHGLPQAIGIAKALDIRDLPGHVYVLIGDGEANEGTIWESALLASQMKLKNLTCIIDDNDSSTRALSMGSFAEKFNVFGWEVHQVNGHDHEQIKEALALRSARMPIAIVAKTIKGYGVPSLQSNPEWHHRWPTQLELEKLIGEIQ